LFLPFHFFLGFLNNSVGRFELHVSRFRLIGLMLMGRFGPSPEPLWQWAMLVHPGKEYEQVNVSFLNKLFGCTVDI